VLEPGARRFGELKELDSSRSICEGRGHRVVTGSDGSIAILHHYQEFDEPPQPTVVSVSRADQPFQPTAVLPAEQVVAGAILDRRGGLHLAMFTADVPPNNRGVLQARTMSINGALDEPTRLGRSTVRSVSASLNVAGRPQIRFRDLTRGPRIATLS